MSNEYPMGEGEVKWTCPEWLDDHLRDGDFMIVDTQPDIHDYIQQHIPGAVYFNENLMRSTDHGRPGVWIPEETAASLIAKTGIDSGMPVVIYTGKGDFTEWGDGLAQTMLAYSLVRYGHRKVWLLDGGIDRWKMENRELVREFTLSNSGQFKPKQREEIFITMDELKKVMHQGDTVLVDVRPSMMYRGQGVWMKPGHIPGAINLPWKMFMNNENPALLKEMQKIREIIKQRNLTGRRDLIFYCGTGREATNAFLLFRYLLGWKNVRLYEGSFTEWSSYPDNPTVTGENRIRPASE